MKPGTSKFLDKFYIVCLLRKTSSSSFLPRWICGVTGNLNLNKTEFSPFSPKKPLIMGEKFKSLFERFPTVVRMFCYKDNALQNGAHTFSPFSCQQGAIERQEEKVFILKESGEGGDNHEENGEEKKKEEEDKLTKLSTSGSAM